LIPADFIAEWRAHARWSTDEQVEQDLALSRALVEVFDDAELGPAARDGDGHEAAVSYRAHAEPSQEGVDHVLHLAALAPR
jgi:hypothetical protein